MVFVWWEDSWLSPVPLLLEEFSIRERFIGAGKEVYWCREGNQHCWGLFGRAICTHNQGAESFGSRDSTSAVFSWDSLMFCGQEQKL